MHTKSKASSLIGLALTLMAASPAVSAQSAIESALSRANSPDTAPSAPVVPSQKQASVGMQDMDTLDVGRLVGIETGDGDFVLASANGRYVIRGELVDSWNQQSIDSLDQLRRSKRTINLGALNVDPASLGALTVGSGEKSVTVFLNPACDDCAPLFEALTNPSPEVTIHVFVVASGGADRETAERVACAAEELSPKDIFSAMASGQAGQLVQRPDCDQRSYMEMLMFGDTLGVKTNMLPYMIRWDGAAKKYEPSDVVAWQLAGGA